MTPDRLECPGNKASRRRSARHRAGWRETEGKGRCLLAVCVPRGEQLSGSVVRNAGLIEAGPEEDPLRTPECPRFCICSAWGLTQGQFPPEGKTGQNQLHLCRGQPRPAPLLTQSPEEATGPGRRPARLPLESWGSLLSSQQMPSGWAGSLSQAQLAMSWQRVRGVPGLHQRRCLPLEGRGALPIPGAGEETRGEVSREVRAVLVGMTLLAGRPWTVSAGLF